MTRIELIATLALKDALQTIAARYQLHTGVEVGVSVRAGSTIVAGALGASGAALFVGPQALCAELGRAGALVPATWVPVAVSSAALAVSPSLATVATDTVEDFLGVLRQARRVAYSAAASGHHFLQVLSGYGLADLVTQKAAIPPPGMLVGELIAAGEAEVGVQQFSELLPIPGILVRALPPEFRQDIGYGVIRIAGTQAHALQDAFVAFLGGEQSRAVFLQNGLKPFGSIPPTSTGGTP
ncbi:MAG: substrate-binding domain-containing protein [Pseudomonadota bacterium]